MTDGTSTTDLKAARVLIRDHLFAISRHYQTLNASDLSQQLALLYQLAVAAGFHIVAGLAQALGDRLAEGGSREDVPVFLHYMTHALTLEPSSDLAILSLLLNGVQRRLDEARLHSLQTET